MVEQVKQQQMLKVNEEKYKYEIYTLMKRLNSIEYCDKWENE